MINFTAILFPHSLFVKVLIENKFSVISGPNVFDIEKPSVEMKRRQKIAKPWTLYRIVCCSFLTFYFL